MRIHEPLFTRLRRLILGASFLAIVFALCSVWAYRAGRTDLLAHIDIPLHLYGGFATALAFVGMLHATYPAKTLHTLPRTVAALSIIGAVGLGAVAWEFLEYFSDTWLHTFLQVSTPETLKDIVVGLAGGSVVAFAWPSSWREQTGTFFARPEH